MTALAFLAGLVAGASIGVVIAGLLLASRDDMTLRDYFAAKAMQAMLSSDLILKHTDKMCDVVPDFHRGNWIGEQAYKFSDAMLAAREVQS